MSDGVILLRCWPAECSAGGCRVIRAAWALTPEPRCRRGYAWMFVTELLYQLRFFKQLPVMAAMLVVNVSGTLPYLCRNYHKDIRMLRCLATGWMRAVTLVAGGLVVVAWLEVRARRIWLRRNQQGLAARRGS